LGGNGAGRRRVIPVSISMVEVIRKKMSSKNAISAIEPAFISCNGLAMSFLFNYLKKIKAILVD
jgi:hypothetical protein